MIGVKVELLVPRVMVRETLERMGVYNRRTKEMTPSCYLASKGINKADGVDFWIMHFKSLMKIHDKDVNMSEIDRNREESIASMLENWGMVSISDRGQYHDPIPERIFVLKSDDKKYAKLNHKWSKMTHIY